MTAILSFGSYQFGVEGVDLLFVSGSIRYPYIKIRRLRNYTTLQIAAKTSENIELRSLMSLAKFQELSDLAAVRPRSPITISGKNWGNFLISNIRRSVRSDGKIAVDVSFDQTEAVEAIGDFRILPNSIGTLGVVDFQKDELLSPYRLDLSYPSERLTRLQNFPNIQDAGDDLIDISLSMKFDTFYNQDPLPLKRLDTFRALGDNYSFYSLQLEDVDYGNYVIEAIAWEMPASQFDPAGNAGIVNMDLRLLQSPAFLPPRLPRIFSFLVNGVEVVDTLAPNLTSLVYQDPLDGGTSILDLEFDTEASNIPTEGDTIRIKFGYDQEGSLPSTNLVDTGIHRCDLPVRRYLPDTITISAQSYNYGLALNSIEDVVFSGWQLNQIINEIAAIFALSTNSNAATIIAGTANTTSVIASVQADSYFDLLQQLARDYGYAFSLKYGEIKFLSYTSLENTPYSFGLTPTDCTKAEFRTKVKGTYRQAIFPHKSGSATVNDSSVVSNDILDFRPSPYYEDASAALQRSTGELRKYNRQRHEGTLAIEGKPNAIAGINILLSSFENASDNAYFQVNEVIHRLTATNGWTTEMKIRKIFV